MLVVGWSRVSPLYRCSRSLNCESRPVTLFLSLLPWPSQRNQSASSPLEWRAPGKSTFVQRLNAHLHALSPPTPPYVVNLDPAVTNISYEPNIDIRDTCRLPSSHEAVRSRSRSSTLPSPLSSSLQRYNLGPNGGILTALNLFTTKFDQVLDLVEKRAENVECAVISLSGSRVNSYERARCICPVM